MNLTDNRFIISKKMIQNIPVLTYTNHDQIPKPLVIMSHGFTSCKEDLIPCLKELANMGYYAVGLDNRLHGERTGDGFETVFSEGNRLNCFKLFNAIKENAEDIRILIEYFVHELDIDITRVGMLGISMGGFTTYRAMAIDKRIKVAVPMISSAVWGDAPADVKTDDSPEVIKAFEALSKSYSPSNNPNTFYPAAILMQAGGIDGHYSLVKLRDFYHTLKSNYQSMSDRVNLIVHEGVAHTVTPEMWKNAKEWLEKYL